MPLLVHKTDIQNPTHKRKWQHSGSQRKERLSVKIQSFS